MKTTQNHRQLSRRYPWLPILMTIEFVISTLNCFLLCAGGILNAISVRGGGIFKHICEFQGWCCLIAFFALPLCIILSLWKSFLSITKYGFLLIGSLCIISGITPLFLVCLGNLGIIKPHCFGIWFVPLIAVYGVDCLIRCLCCKKYESAFYSTSLHISYKKDIQGFHSLLTTLLLFITVYVTLFLLTKP